MYFANTEHFGGCAFCFFFIELKFHTEGSVLKVVLNIQHSLETSVNVVQSDDCQNVLPKLNIQSFYITYIYIAIFNSLANAPMLVVFLLMMAVRPLSKLQTGEGYCDSSFLSLETVV